MLKIIIASVILLISQTAYSDAAVIPFKATYQLSHKKDPVGKAVRQLEYTKDGNIRYSNKLDSKWFIFSDHRNEVSIVSLNNNLITPIHYTYSRTGTGKDKRYDWYYDTENKKLMNNKSKQITDLIFPDNFQDKLSYHLQLSLDLMNKPLKKEYNYPVISSSGKISDTRYEVVGKETLTLPYGIIDTIKIKREIAEKKRITYAWFAPKLNHTLVKLSQFKNGKENFDVKLSSLEFDTENKSEIDNKKGSSSIEEKLPLEKSTETITTEDEKG